MYNIEVCVGQHNHRAPAADGVFWAPAEWLHGMPPWGLLLFDGTAYLLGKGQKESVTDFSRHRLNQDGDWLTIHWHRRPTPILMTDDPTAPASAPNHEPMRLSGPGIPPSDVRGELLLLGRHPSCDVRFEDTCVSAFHCALLPDRSGGTRVIDLRSRNGTYLNGQRVRDAIVHRQGWLRLGAHALLLTPESTGEHHIHLPSAAMVNLEATIDRIAGSNSTVLLQGPSGVGKDRLARRLHDASGRPGHFVPFNASGLHGELVSSTLFGHTRGAFTGAVQANEGLFAHADGGTLFIDEVAEMPLAAQAELLRALDQKTIRRVGDCHERPVDVRIVAATNQPLNAAAELGKFRPDLFYRLAVISLDVPPLRDRPEDLDALARGFLAAQSVPRTLTKAAWKKLHGHPWPGNVRELRNVLLRACCLHRQETLDARHLETDLFGPDRPTDSPAYDLVHNAILDLCEAHEFNVQSTAKVLDLTPAAVKRHLRRANLDGERPHWRPWATDATEVV